MKLSTAIRLGAAKRRQAFGCFFELHRGAVIGSCALGAAFEGYTNVPSYGASHGPSLDVLYRTWPELTSPPPSVLTEPSRYPSKTLSDLIVVWNDDCRLSREQIADRLETAGL